jgi:hypothetical protein
MNYKCTLSFYQKNHKVKVSRFNQTLAKLLLLRINVELK